VKTKTGNEEKQMGETSAPDWAVRYSQVISAQVRYYRNLRGLSAQQVSDRCGELGMPLARAVISHLENGRRESVSVGEVFCLAKVLEVAPIDLLTVKDGGTEIAPGLVLDRASAVGWIAGAPDWAAINAAAADLAQAQADAERAHRRVEEASRRFGDLLGSAPAR
jgi:transcriptional regulator with XRE-family HTH domain